MAEALAIDSHYDGLIADYTRRRKKLCDALMGLTYHPHTWEPPVHPFGG